MNIFYGGFKNKLEKNKEESFKTALHDMKQILDKNNQKFFLAAGTLLGQYRDNKFIPYDEDIDLGILYNNFDPNIKYKIIESDKFRLVSELGNIDENYESSYVHNNGVKVDLFVHYPMDKNNYYIGSFFGICDNKKEGYCKLKYPIKGLKKVKFYNKTYLVPKNSKEYLIKAYGKDFMTPKNFSYWDGINGAYKNIIN